MVKLDGLSTVLDFLRCISLKDRTMPQINIEARVDENGLLCLKMPDDFAGMEIKGKLLYQVYAHPLPPTKKRKIDIDAVRNICNQIRNLPVLDDRSADEIIGYNE